MKEKIKKEFTSDLEKDYIEKEIRIRLQEVTSQNNIITLTTDSKFINEEEFVRVTVFVENKDRINFSKLHVIENSLKIFFGTAFKFTFCNAEMKFDNILKLSAIKGSGSISFIDLENLIDKNECEFNKDEAMKNLLQSTIKISNKDAIVICANKNLINKFKNIINDFPKNRNLVLIETEGKDCSDFRLVQSINKLYNLKKLTSFERINLFSGDKFFISITKWLISKKLNVCNFGQQNKTSKEYFTMPTFSEIDDLCNLKVA